jgi:CDP-glucose 4,6-dehydratase
MIQSKLELYKGKKVLITGHTGFKGSWLSQWMILLGAKVYGISDCIPTTPSNFETLGLKSNLNHSLININDLKKTREKIIEIQPDFVFHLAAQAIVSTSYENPLETLQTNAIGTTNILESLRSLEKKCVAIFITSDKCYENVEWEWGYKETDPLGGKDIYSASKAAAEIIISAYYRSFFLKKNNIRLASTRAGNVIGGGDWAKDRIIPDCIRSWAKKEKVTIRNPYATRPWQHVLEPLSGYMTVALELWKNDIFNGESFNFGPNFENNINVLQLLEKTSKYFDFNSGEDAYFFDKSLSFPEAGLLNLNFEKSRFHLKWKPALDLEKTIKFTGEWYKNFIKKDCNMEEFTSDQIRNYMEIAQSKNIKWAKPPKPKSSDF